MTTALKSFNKNPNVGLYGFATEKFVLVGKEIRDEQVKDLERIFKVPVHRITIAGTSLIGVFVVGNEDLVLVPGITFENELKEVEKLDIKYEVFKSDLTCLGNNIVMTRSGALVNPEFSKQEMETIKSLFGIPVEKIHLADTETPGSCIVINKDLALIHSDAGSKDISKAEKILNVKATPSTVNMGVPYVKSGILCNSHGMLLGELSGPAEIMNAEESLGYLD